MPKNKILVDLWLEDGCSKEDGEVAVSWHPINFSIYSTLFPDMIQEAIDEWIADHNIAKEHHYELIFQHTVESDGGGAVSAEYFEAIHVDTYGGTSRPS